MASRVDSMTLILSGSAILALVVAIVLVRRRRAHAHRVEALPPLVFEVRDRREPLLRPAGFRDLERPVAYAPPTQWPSMDARTVQVPRAAPSTTGYLPGWLEIADGPHKGEVIRFPRLADASDYTLGRGEGPARTHVQLPVTSVSRQQARMRWANGRWQLINLSQTNPTVVNGRTLEEPEGVRWLQDGDTVEMGDLVLRFRAR